MNKLLPLLTFSILLLVPVGSQNAFAGMGGFEDKDNDGFSTLQGDCDDNDKTVFPGASEVEDGKDNNCDGVVDEGFDNLVGGELIPKETTSLILAGTQSFSWMIPVTLSVLGIGLFVVSRKN